MLYPLVPDCPTQPRITITNITLRNVSGENGFLPPGIIRCNAKNPCKGINFDGVNFGGWFGNFGLGYIVENALGTVTKSYPPPKFNV